MKARDIISKAISGLVLVLAPVTAVAQGFAVEVTPPRFEASARPGTVFRNVIQINNVSGQDTKLQIRTADWVLDENGSAQFDYDLGPGSCRPWVGIEAREIVVPAEGRRRFRFEVAVPEGTPDGECRFGLMLEGEPELVEGGPPVPVAGRIGIIVYLAIGDAAPSLELVDIRVEDVGGRALPVLTVRNTGNAHGRLQGFMDATDGEGRRLSLAPSTSPILPGASREISLHPLAEGDEAPAELRWPLRLQGKLDAGLGELSVDAEVSPAR